MSDDSDVSSNRNRKKRKTFLIEDASDSDSSIDTTRRKRKKHRICGRDSDSESNSSIEIVHKKRVGRVTSDTDECSSGSEIVRSKRAVGTLASDSESSDSSDCEFESDWVTETEFKATPDMKSNLKNDSSSESGDDQLEKCPICLLPFKNQEVGSPESCDHSFCIDCILEWSKNVNTCPVDRQIFNLILVRSNYNGKVIKQIPIESTQPQNNINEIVEDPTFCEICGSCEREDRMLLCDGCDLGFHLECLNPPLDDVPPGLWFCPDCGPGDENNMIDIYEVHLLLEDAEQLGWPNGPRSRNSTPRLVPRTRQSERVRARVITHRNQRQRNENVQENELERNQSQPGPSGSSDRNMTTTNRSNRRRKKRSKKSKIKITYEIDQATGERIAIETRIKHKNRRNKKQRQRARMVRRAMRSVKGRLALQLGVCSSNNGQNIIQTRAPDNTNTIGYQRSQAGIPTLDLFGRRDDLDYYGGTDSEEDISNADILIRRRPHTSDVTLFRRAARRKAIIAPVQQQSVNVLDSILDIQSKFHSKNSVMSLNKDGTLKIDKKEFVSNNNNDIKNKDKYSRKNGDRINLNDHNNIYFKQTPMYGNGSSSPPSAYNNNADFGRRSNLDTGNAVTTSTEQIPHGSTSSDRDEDRQSYSSQRVCSSYEYDSDKKERDKDKSRSNTPGTHNSDSELDIYSDIETVSTSRVEEFDAKLTSPAVALTPNTPTDEDANNSDVDLIIDTEKGDDSKEQVSSTVDLADPMPVTHTILASHSISEPQNRTLEIQNQTVQSTNSKIGNEKEDKDEDEDDDSEDGCPNFSIYSSESINLAKTTDLQLLSEKDMSKQIPNEVDAKSSEFVGETDSNVVLCPSPVPQNTFQENNTGDDGGKKEKYSYGRSGSMHCGLYSDSDDETLVKITKMPFGNENKIEDPELSMICKTNENDKDAEVTENTSKTKKPFALGDISNMTEDISEEERSYTPCLDERTQRQGLEGLDTEMISDEDRNDFDESHELKTASDGDALEINAKESELDFTKPEDYEEGEIVDKLKNKKPPSDHKNPSQEKEPEKEESKEESKEAETVQTSFKKLSKNNKERNYREKDKESNRSKSKERKSDKENKKEKKKEKRKELERYNVRSMIAEKPRRIRDKFGRDETRRKSPSRSSRSLTPPIRRSFSRGRSYSRERTKKRRARTKSRSRTPPERRRSRSPRPRRQKSGSRERFRSKWRNNRSRERYNSKTRQSVSPRRRREWIRRSSKGWSRSLSRSYTPEQRLTPSWTPPRLLESQPVKPQNLTVILNNDHNKKKKDKRKKDKRKETEKTKKRRRNRTPPPSKEVFASGNNILVSVSFNKDKNQRDVTNKRKRDLLDESVPKKQRKIKEKRKNDNKRKKKKKDLTGVKPVAIIDLDRSPFREVTPSPEDVIVLTDSENAESNDMLGLQKAICDSSQQVASPEMPINTNYLTGPKTPPEPQVKFTLNPKQTQIRAISNPLHEPDDIEGEIDPQEELEQRLNESLHKGPNTPPEPPISPPSSPDAYDPFEPTKSRSPTPEPLPPTVQLSSTSQNDSVREESLIDSRNDDDETNDQSHTPPVITDIQPADSQCSNMKPMSPEKSPEQHIGVIINRVVQSQASLFPSSVSKTIPTFSNTSMVASTPMVAPRINILNSTVLTPTTIASALPQRIVLPNTTKSSPVKVSPNKLPIKSTPIKPMPAKNLMNKSVKSSRKSNNHNGNDNSDALLDFESPYSPGSSDYEDLFEPPPPSEVTVTKSANKQPTQKSKDQSTFDILFGSSPVNNCFKNNKNKSKPSNNINKYKKNAKGTKQVGVKIDEDTLKILDELPNSAVEMQVKYKYLKKLNRQERVVEEVKLVLKPHYNKKHINKEEYKDILRRAVPKICHNKSGEINPQKIQNLIEAYVKKIRHSKKVTSSSSVNPQKA